MLISDCIMYKPVICLISIFPIIIVDGLYSKIIIMLVFSTRPSLMYKHLELDKHDTLSITYIFLLFPPFCGPFFERDVQAILKSYRCM